MIARSQREGFRIVEYSIQADHLHMLLEADDAALLTLGMRGFTVRVAMRIDSRIFGRRRGKVWGDRFHARELTNPTEVRNTLVYVLKNAAKHRVPGVGLIDPCSSAPWFGGWMHIVAPPPEPPSVVAARTGLLREGWTTVGHGLLHVGELPRAARVPRQTSASSRV
jgi:hypothetical protein